MLCSNCEFRVIKAPGNPILAPPEFTNPALQTPNTDNMKRQLAHTNPAIQPNAAVPLVPGAGFHIPPPGQFVEPSKLKKKEEGPLNPFFRGKLSCLTIHRVFTLFSWKPKSWL
jgi:hypothetical protein